MRLTGKDTTVNETPLKMSHFGAKLMCFHFSEIWTFAAKKYFLNYSFLFISQNCSLSCLKNNRFFSSMIMILRFTAFCFQAHFSPRIKKSRKVMNLKLSSDIFRFWNKRSLAFVVKWDFDVIFNHCECTKEIRKKVLLLEL